ncbi:MAG: hypothetical protein P8I90_10815 [Glaciecola sp.]|nr:hypothetical protein [Glaciecola sp.]
MENSFANYQITIPTKYQDKVKKYCRTGGVGGDTFNAPFKRQVDLWFFALCISFKEGLIREKLKDTYNATTAAILSNDQYRVHLMYLIALADTTDEAIVTDSKAVFDICCEYANAGIPFLLELLDDPDQKPIWNAFDYLEG